MTAEEIRHLIEASRIDISTEAALQRGLRTLLASRGIAFDAEVILNKRDRIDFLVGSVGIEAKIRATRREIIRQLDRYAESDQIGALILATATSFPTQYFEANGKPVLIANLSKGWL